MKEWSQLVQNSRNAGHPELVLWQMAIIQGFARENGVHFAKLAICGCWSGPEGQQQSQ